jgi:hypothetical protein
MPTFLHAQQAVVVARAKSFQEYAKAQSAVARSAAAKAAQAASSAPKKKP